ncbi:MAG TPA: adenine phosphoribosyltransferase [Polyangia bacterium]|nr:adenine phosphoribosyltransferase [Polyangia bacterium]
MSKPNHQVEDPRLGLLRARVRDIPDFPKPGILFRDLTPLMADGAALQHAVALLAERLGPHRPEAILAVESRGFIFGAPVAAALGIGFVPVRKPGKLPHKTARRDYALEYGTDALEMHADAIVSGARVALVDDLLATGGTAGATIELVRELGGSVVVAAFVVELAFLEGRPRLGAQSTESLIVY